MGCVLGGVPPFDGWDTNETMKLSLGDSRTSFDSIAAALLPAAKASL